MTRMAATAFCRRRVIPLALLSRLSDSKRGSGPLAREGLGDDALRSFIPSGRFLLSICLAQAASLESARIADCLLALARSRDVGRERFTNIRTICKAHGILYPARHNHARAA